MTLDEYFASLPEDAFEPRLPLSVGIENALGLNVVRLGVGDPAATFQVLPATLARGEVALCAIVNYTYVNAYRIPPYFYGAGPKIFTGLIQLLLCQDPAKYEADEGNVMGQVFQLAAEEAVREVDELPAGDHLVGRLEVETSVWPLQQRLGDSEIYSGEMIYRYTLQRR